MKKEGLIFLDHSRARKPSPILLRGALFIALIPCFTPPFSWADPLESLFIALTHEFNIGGRQTYDVFQVGSEQGAPGPVEKGFHHRRIVFCDEENSGVRGNTRTVRPVLAVAGRAVDNGFVFAMGHTELFGQDIHRLDNERLAWNVLAWLGAGRPDTVLFRRTCNSAHVEDSLGTLAQSMGFETRVVPLDMKMTWRNLNSKEIGILVVPDRWASFEDNGECETIEDFARNGGGVLLMGRFWAWSEANPGRLEMSYPMNLIGKRLSVSFKRGRIYNYENHLPESIYFPIFRGFYSKKRNARY